MIAQVDVQRSATSLPFGALSRAAFSFVRHQARTVGMLAWFIRNQMRQSRHRDNRPGWDDD